MSVLKQGQTINGRYLCIPGDPEEALLCAFCSAYVPPWTKENPVHIWVIQNDLTRNAYCTKDCAMEDDLTD